MRCLLPLAFLALSACAVTDAALEQPPTLLEITDVGRALRELPPPSRPVPISVYAFGDLTGQHKPNEAFAEYSRAVTQGPLPMLVKALSEARGGRWFTVIERENGTFPLLLLVGRRP